MVFVGTAVQRLESLCASHCTLLCLCCKKQLRRTGVVAKCVSGGLVLRLKFRDEFAHRGNFMNDVNPLASTPDAAPSLCFAGMVRVLDVIGIANVEPSLFQARTHEVGGQAADSRCIDDVMNGAVDDHLFVFVSIFLPEVLGVFKAAVSLGVCFFVQTDLLESRF